MQKRFLIASIALHLTVFLLIVGSSLVRIRGPRPGPRPSVPLLVNLIEVPRPAAPREVQHPESAIAYPHAPVRPKLAATPAPAATPTPAPTVRPTPTPLPREVAEYRRLNPALQKETEDRARMMVARLKALGLSAASASEITRAVDRAILEGSQRLYSPTTPEGTGSGMVMAGSAGTAGAAGGAATDSPFVPPVSWVSTPSAIESWLGRVLPPDKGYDAELTTDPATGLPELRLLVRKEVNYPIGFLETRTFIERWDPAGAATPVVEVTVLKPSGEQERAFKMPLAPLGEDLEKFKDHMFGMTLLAYQEALAGRTLPLP